MCRTASRNNNTAGNESARRGSCFNTTLCKRSLILAAAVILEVVLIHSASPSLSDPAALRCKILVPKHVTDGRRHGFEDPP